jgi:hypothetical protein
MSVNLPRPNYTKTTSLVPGICHTPSPGQAAWYPPVMAGADTLGAKVSRAETVLQALVLMQRLSPDAYTTYLKDFYGQGLERFGSHWRYADIVTVLLCLSDALKPRTYLEVGVRRGRSAAAVASKAPNCTMALFDMWQANYAGMENPGPDFVKQELQRIGFKGQLGFVDGNSHETLPAVCAKNPDVMFDIITVDGDHSELGAAQDMCDVLPRLAIGGAIVFDDISHPIHPELNRVWEALVVSDDRFSTFSYREAGYGVGFAIRKY